jgi:hypothetical protein
MPVIISSPKLPARSPTSMVIYDFDIVRLTIDPAKTNAPLIVDPDRMLPGSTATQGLQPVAGRNAEIVQSGGSVKQQKLAADDTFDRRKAADRPVVEEQFGIALREGSNHRLASYSANGIPSRRMEGSAA